MKLYTLYFVVAASHCVTTPIFDKPLCICLLTHLLHSLFITRILFLDLECTILVWGQAFGFFFFFSPEFKSMNLVLYNCAHYIKWSVPLWRIWDETPCSNWFPFLPFQTFWKILVASLIMSSLRDIACHCRRSSLNGVGYLDPFYLIWCQILISAKFGRLIIPELIF